MWNDDRRIITSHLSPGEKLLWFGRPRQGFFFRSSDAVTIPFSLMWGGFAIFWETSVWAVNAPFFFKLWGIPFVPVGLYMIFGRFIVDIWQRKKTVYGVTNERIIIVSGLFSRSIKSLTLSALTDITLDEKTDGRETITFGPPNSSDSRGVTFGRGRRNEPDLPSFEQIEKAKSVYDTIRNAQKQTS